MSTPSKAQLLNEVHALLKKRYKPKPDPSPGRLSVLEGIVYGICHEGTTREQANQALSRFKDDFFDWNEVRVSSVEEIKGMLAGLPDPEDRAYRLRRFLRQLFEKTYGFNLDPLAKKPLKESIKALREYEVFNSDYLTAIVTQQTLGGHAIPVDAPIRRALIRLGIGDADTDIPTLRGILERAVPKNRGAEFFELLEELAHDTCIEGPPDCPRCELRKICPTGLARKEDRGPAKAVGAKHAKPASAESKPDPAAAISDGDAAEPQKPGRGKTRHTK